MFGSTTDGIRFKKGTVDATIAYTYDDGVSFIILFSGSGFDILQFLANLAPGPHVTRIVTLTDSATCKTFV